MDHPFPPTAAIWWAGGKAQGPSDETWESLCVDDAPPLSNWGKANMIRPNLKDDQCLAPQRRFTVIHVLLRSRPAQKWVFPLRRFQKYMLPAYSKLTSVVSHQVNIQQNLLWHNAYWLTWKNIWSKRSVSAVKLNHALLISFSFCLELSAIGPSMAKSDSGNYWPLCISIWGMCDFSTLLIECDVLLCKQVKG